MGLRELLFNLLRRGQVALCGGGGLLKQVEAGILWIVVEGNEALGEAGGVEPAPRAIEGTAHRGEMAEQPGHVVGRITRQPRCR